MESPLEVDFQGVEDSPPIHDAIDAHISKLEKLFGRVTACRVVIKGPSGHHKKGGQFEIKIHLLLPDEREVNVERTPTEDERYSDLNFALSDAFKRARRQMQEQVSRLRGE